MVYISLTFAVQPVAEVNPPYPAVGVDLNSQRLEIIGAYNTDMGNAVTASAVLIAESPSNFANAIEASSAAHHKPAA
jgi:hypothetical protein